MIPPSKFNVTSFFVSAYALFVVIWNIKSANKQLINNINNSFVFLILFFPPLFNIFSIFNKEALKHQNQYPTLFITLKDMKNSSYEKQMNRFKEVICLCAKSHLELLNSERLLASEKKLFQKYVDNETEDNELEKSLFLRKTKKISKISQYQ